MADEEKVLEPILTEQEKEAITESTKQLAEDMAEEYKDVTQEEAAERIISAMPTRRGKLRTVYPSRCPSCKAGFTNQAFLVAYSTSSGTKLRISKGTIVKKERFNPAPVLYMCSSCGTRIIPEMQEV